MCACRKAKIAQTSVNQSQPTTIAPHPQQDPAPVSQPEPVGAAR